MVDESHYDMWIKAISSPLLEESVFMVVAVKKRIASVEEGESISASQAHHQAQNILQQPRYVIEGTDEMCVDEKNDSRREATDDYLSSIVKKEVSAKTANADRMSVHDFTGRWMEICSVSGVSESADSLYSSVILLLSSNLRNALILMTLLGILPRLKRKCSSCRTRLS
jgi:hypothetical protein